LNENQLIELIKKDIEKKSKMLGRKYYNKKGSISKKSELKDIVDSNNEIKTIKINDGTNIYFNWFKILIKQKINYMLAKDTTITKNQYFTDIVLTTMLEELVLNTSIDSVSWLHFFVNTENKLDWVVVSFNEIIPIYDKYNKYIIEIIRYYYIDKDTIYIENWDKNGVTTMKLKKDKISDNVFNKHYTEEISYQGEILEENDKNFPFIPFIPMWNNRERLSDIEDIECLIVMYSNISSGLIDNIDKFQEAIAKFKGFTGDSKAIQEAMRQMKIYKGVGIPNDGDIDYMNIEIPVEARALILETLKDAIFFIGEGFDPHKIGDGNITNVVIESRYSGLDMKSNACEKQLKLFYQDFIKCFNKFYNISLDSKIELNRSMIFNKSEAIADAVASKDLTSLETALSIHPYVTDVKKEMKLIEDETAKNIENQSKLFNNNINDKINDTNNNNNNNT
jgi:SPP1 family phage portal protein